MRKFTVFLKLLGSEIYIIARRISKAVVYKIFNNADNSIDILGCFGMNCCLTDIKTLGIGPELLNITLRNL